MRRRGGDRRKVRSKREIGGCEKWGDAGRLPVPGGKEKRE